MGLVLIGVLCGYGSCFIGLESVWGKVRVF